MKGIVFILAVLPLVAQPTLTLSSGKAKPGQTATLELTQDTAADGEVIFGVQWTLKFPTKVRVKVLADPESSGAAYVCAASETGDEITCMFFGVPYSGVVAKVEVSLPPDFSGTESISVINVIGVELNGGPVEITGVSGTVSAILPDEYEP